MRLFLWIEVLLAPLYLYLYYLTFLYIEPRYLTQVYCIANTHIILTYEYINYAIECKYMIDLKHWREIIEIAEPLYTYYEKNTALPSPYNLSLQNSRHYPMPVLEDRLMTELPREMAIVQICIYITTAASLGFVLVGKMM